MIHVGTTGHSSTALPFVSLSRTQNDSPRRSWCFDVTSHSARPVM